MWSTLSLGKYAVSPVGTPMMTERGMKGDKMVFKKEKREQRKEESRRLNGLDSDT